MYSKLGKNSKILLIIVTIFAFISLLTINSAMTYIPASNGNLVLKQALWYLIGIALVLVIMHFKNEYLYRNAFVLYIIFCILLFLLLIFGEPVHGSKCWFKIPYIGSFQPSEFMKIILMLVLSVMINNYKAQYNDPKIKEEAIFILKTFIIFLIPSVLTFLEPDTGSVIMYFIIYISMMFAGGIRLRWFVILVAIIGIIITAVLLIYGLNSNLFVKIFGTNLFYRIDRVMSWKDGEGMQVTNALASIGSAGVFGHGYNNTPLYFPESATDFIFAVYASNFGLVGGIFLIGLILAFDIRLIRLIDKKIIMPDKYVLIGIISCLVFQQVENIGMTLGLLPVTGITLPFISYGGSSLLSYMLMLGIIMNISEESSSHKYRYKF